MQYNRCIYSKKNLTPEQKETMLNDVTDAVMEKLGYTTYENVIVTTDEKGQDGKDIKGFYSQETEDAYINDKNNKNTEDLVTTSGHEMAHAMDSQDGQDLSTNKEDNNIYADNFGGNLASYTNFALDITGQGSMATTNNHAQPTSLEDYQQLQQNNNEFAGLDKKLGDNSELPSFELPTDINFGVNGLTEWFADTTVGAKDEAIEKAPEAASLAISVAGGIEGIGVKAAWTLWGTGAVLDTYSAIESGEARDAAGIVAIPPAGKSGTAFSVLNSLNNLVKDDE